MIHTTRRATLIGGTALLAGMGRPRAATPTVKIGVLTDLSGIVADNSGRGSIEAARMAAEEFGDGVAGHGIEVVFADLQNKPDIGAAIARQWFDQDSVSVIADVPNSAVALAVQQLARERGKVALISGAASTVLTNAQCSPTGFLWTIDTYAVAHGTANAVVQTGGDTWFIIAADYAFGEQMQKDIASVVAARGGRVTGAVRHPPGASDFSSFLLQAQASGAKVIGVANAGADTVNLLKQANEFGITAGGQRVATMFLTLADVDSMGLAAAQGAIVTEPFYWDRDEATRAWSHAFQKRVGRMPGMFQIGCFEAVRHYLQAIAASGTTDGNAVAAQMRAVPIRSVFTDNVRIRADGRVLRPMLLERVKAPAESRYAWDYMEIVRPIPAEDVVWPASESGCTLLRS